MLYGEPDVELTPVEQEPVDHRAAIELALCQRDYELMAEHHPALLQRIEVAVADGVTSAEIKRWTQATVSEPGLVQRVFNAARWVAKQ